jgi:hypothetical protein
MTGDHDAFSAGTSTNIFGSGGGAASSQRGTGKSFDLRKAGSNSFDW